MQDDQLPILIFAQSARFIAQSAAQTGYTVWAVDCYGDQDTIEACERFFQLPDFNHLSETSLCDYLTQLSQGQACQLIYGTGIERFYPALSLLPEHIKVIGNSVETINQLRNPELVFKLLKQLQIPHPDTIFQLNNLGSNTQHLEKSLSSSGGMGITQAPFKVDNNVFYQQYIEGNSASATFIADGKRVRLLAFNLQVTNKTNFRLHHLVQPFTVAESVKNQIKTYIQKIVRQTTYKGLGSIDFIIDKNHRPFVLEVNPRITASCEQLTDKNLLVDWQINACRAINPKLPDTINTSSETRMLSYLYATKRCHALAMNWPDNCYDIPQPDTNFEPGEPICSVITHGHDQADCLKKWHKTETEVRNNCLSAA